MNPFLFASLVAFLALLRCLLLSACRAWDSLAAAAGEVHHVQVLRYRSCHLFTGLSSLSCRKNSLFLFPFSDSDSSFRIRTGPDRFVQRQKFQNQFARISSASRNLLNETFISSSVSGPRAAEPRVHDSGDRHRGRDLLALHRPPRPHERVPRPGAQRAGKSHFQLTG